MEKKDSHMAVADIFIRLIRCALSGVAPERSDLEGLSEEQLQELAALAKKHDLLHLVGAALESADLPDKTRFERFQQAELSAMFRYQLLHSETVKLCRLLEESRIPYIPLLSAGCIRSRGTEQAAMWIFWFPRIGCRKHRKSLRAA